MGYFDGIQSAWDKSGGDKVVDAATLGAYGTLMHKPADKADTSGEEAQMRQSIEDLKGAAPTSQQSYKYAGDFDPTMLSNLPQQGSTEFSGISVDPSTRAAQMSALSQLQSRTQDGYNAQDRAAIAQVQGDNAQQEASQRGALQANMQARGAGGSGAELAMQLANQQGAASRNNTAGLQIAAGGRAQALQAIMQSGQLAGQVHDQDYNEQAQRAQAQDKIKQFNTQTGVAAAVQNNQTTNQYGAMNSQNRQLAANKEVTRVNDFGQQQFGNQGTVTSAQTGAAVNSANMKIGQQAADEAKIAAGKDRYVKVAGMVADYAKPTPAPAK